MVLCGYTRALLAFKNNAECLTGEVRLCQGLAGPNQKHAQRFLIFCEMQKTMATL